MAAADFDVDELAAMLHVTPDQVQRMADRGRLPGRKVAGQYRFPRAEIHHWLEEQIGASSTEGLDQVEAVLARQPQPTEGSIHLADVCPLESIAVPLDARTRGSVIRGMCHLAAASGMLWDPAAMAEAVEAREQLHPTALDSGVALLHPRRPQTSILADTVVALGVCPQGIAFAGRGQLTDVFFLLASYDDRSHLQLLARLSRMVAQSEFLDRLRQATSASEARHALLETEAELYPPEGPE